MQRKFDLLRWTPGRIAHVAHHGVTPEEPDEVLGDPGGVLVCGRSGFYRLYGKTGAGRKLLLVLADEGAGIGGPVTARDLTDAERRRYCGDD